MTGDLILHGGTKVVTLTAVVEGTEVEPWGNDRVGLSVTGQISRGEYGMKFKLSLDVSAVKQA